MPCSISWGTPPACDGGRPCPLERRRAHCRPRSVGNRPEFPHVGRRGRAKDGVGRAELNGTKDARGGVLGQPPVSAVGRTLSRCCCRSCVGEPRRPWCNHATRRSVARRRPAAGGMGQVRSSQWMKGQTGSADCHSSEWPRDSPPNLEAGTATAGSRRGAAGRLPSRSGCQAAGRAAPD